MDRLTRKLDDGTIAVTIQNGYDYPYKLWQYENTGYGPEDLINGKYEIKKNHINNDYN